ncbi:MAG: site-2 protease family protein [Blastocatellia bacterium]|nr:site-2 protease family protein [Blastocatellia bacterium]
MFESSIKLGTIMGIHVRLSRSWILVFGVTALLMSEYVRMEFPAWNPFQRYLWGLAASLLFFFSVLLHELGHSLAARFFGIRAQSITLHPFGGIAKLAREALTPVEEFWIALSGPGVNLLFGGLLAVLGLLTATTYKGVSFLMHEVSTINFVFGAFNLLPGFPLDGGRTFRALIWWLTKDYRKATQYAAVSGQILAALFMMFGIFFVFEKQGLGFIWFVMGLYLLSAARTGYEQAELRELLRTITVNDLGWEELPQVSKTLSLLEFLAQFDFGMRDRSFLVMDGQVIVGVVSLQEARLAHEQNQLTGEPIPTLADLMTPIERFERISPQTDLGSVVEKMEYSEVSLLPVVANNEFQGFVGREAITNIVRQRFGHET